MLCRVGMHGRGPRGRGAAPVLHGGAAVRGRRRARTTCADALRARVSIHTYSIFRKKNYKNSFL